MIPFAETVLLWRLERGLTQNELAKKAGIPRPNLSAIERGKREVSLRTIYKLARALDLNPGALVDGLPPGKTNFEQNLTREAMERIAKAVVLGINLPNPNERKLAEQLTHLTKARLAAVKTRKADKSKRLPDRKTDIVWLTLVSRYSPGIIKSMVTRISEYAQTHEQKSD